MTNNILIKPKQTSEEIAANRELLIKRLLYIFGNSMECVNLWLDSPHPWLGGSTPNSYLEDGKIQGVECLVGAIEYGIPG